MIASVLEAMIEGNQIGQPRMVEVGKIKIGGLGPERPKSGGGTFRLPQKLDYFLVTTNTRTEKGDLIPDERLMSELKTRYADSDGKLRQIPIRVLSDEIDDVLQTSIVWYAGKTVAARSDGVNITWNFDGTNGKKLAEPRTEPWAPEMWGMKNTRNEKLFKTHTVLNCTIASKEGRWGGVYRFRTTSVITFQQLYSSLTHIQSLTGGVLVGMPLMLVMRPVVVSPDGKPITVYVAHVELRGEDLQQIQTQALERAKYKITFHKEMQQIQAECRRLLPAPGTETGQEAEEIQAEFAPEESAQDEAKPTQKAASPHPLLGAENGKMDDLSTLDVDALAAKIRAAKLQSQLDTIAAFLKESMTFGEDDRDFLFFEIDKRAGEMKGNPS